MTRSPQRHLARYCALASLTLLILPALLLAGCGATIADNPGGPPPTTTGHSASGSLSDHGLPPIVLRNPAPAILDVSMYVTFEQGVQETQLMAEVGLAFQSGGQVVQFAGDEYLTCDGAALPLHDRDAAFQVIRAPAAQLAGATIACVYQAGQTHAGMLLRIPQPPTITAPHDGAAVPRSSHTVVTYRYDPASTGTLLGIVALAPGSTVPKTLARLNTPVPGQATADTSHFSSGPGSFVLTATLAPHITGDGTPFKSLNANGSATAPVNVTWT